MSGDTVTAEQLHERAGFPQDHVGDLILDNLDYDAGLYDDAALCAAVYAWANQQRGGYHIRSHYHDDKLTLRGYADNYTLAHEQAYAEWQNNGAAYVEVVRGDELIWSSKDGFRE